MRSVADHKAYNEAHQEIVDWLSDAEEQLDSISSNRWDCLETVMQHLNVIKVQMMQYSVLLSSRLLYFWTFTDDAILM